MSAQMNPLPAVSGTVAPGFEPVRERFAANFQRDDHCREVGAALSVFHGGATIQLEVSLGAADYTSAEGLDESIQLADDAMYRQKHARKSPEAGVRTVRISAPVATIDF